MKFIKLFAIAISAVASNEISEAFGEIFIGMMSATQANMYNTANDCYVAAEDVYTTLNTLVDDQDFGLVQVLNIKVQSTLSTCNLEIMIQSLDSRMSSLDFTLGIISNVMSQTGGGFQTQDWEKAENTSSTPVYITLNEVYPFYDAQDWINVGRFMMLLIVQLLNFESPKVQAGLSTF